MPNAQHLESMSAASSGASNVAGISVRDRLRHALALSSLACVSIVLAACASRPVVLERSNYWPFEKIRLQSAAVGELTAYAHRPAAAVRAVVIVQSPPCVTAPVHAADPVLSTGGVLWDELKRDSVVLQLERPGKRPDEEPAAADCRPTLRTGVTPHAWSRAIRDAFTVAAGDLRLPTVYIGIGQGAWPAAHLAASDPRASALLIINGTGLNPRFESLLAEVRRTDRPPAQDLFAGVPTTTNIPVGERSRLTTPAAPLLKVPTLLIQSTASNDSQLESALVLLSEHANADPKVSTGVSLVVAEGLGTDFGLDSGQIDCFANMMRLIALHARSSAQPGAGTVTRTHCGMPEHAPPEQPRTEPVRLPDDSGD
jgi:hypothetical protein